MRYYFEIQVKRLKRKFVELGINPYLGLTLATIIFFSFSKYLFYRTSYAKFIYVLVGISFILKLGEKNRNDHLTSIFPKKKFILIRILENIILAFPLLVYLLYEENYLMILVLSIFSILIAPINFKHNFNLKIPTPFKKFPFEFIVGFRKAYFLYMLSYFLCYKAIQVGNFNLGLFSLGVVYLISMLFFFRSENSYFVWIYSVNSKIFLFKKILSSFICSSIIAVPSFVILLFFFKTNYLLILGVVLFGLILLTSIIFAKYSTFPNEMNLPQGILYGVSIWFPPLLIITIPYFYIQSKRSLELILE